MLIHAFRSEYPENKKSTCLTQMLFFMYVTRFELATFWSVARRSIQLSYTYTCGISATNKSLARLDQFVKDKKRSAVNRT